MPNKDKKGETFEKGLLVQVSFFARVVNEDSNGMYEVKCVGNIDGEETVMLPASLIVPAKTFAVKDRVECNFGGKNKWFSGMVVKVRDDESYDILYDDGDKELRIPLSRIRPVALSEEVDPSAMKVGIAVEVRFKGKHRYYAAKVAKINTDGTYQLSYGDGEVEDKVPVDLLRQVSGLTLGSDADEHYSHKGQAIEANYKNSGKWYKGSISHRHSNGTYDVKYDDGDCENGVPPTHVRKAAVVPGAKVDTNDAAKAARQAIAGGETFTQLLKDRQRVSCNFKGQGVWHLAEITYFREDEGTYNVEYDDINLFKENKVPMDRLRAINFREGDRVLGNFRGEGAWHLGTVSAVHEEGATLYNVEYDDAEFYKEEKIVGKRLTQVIFREGDKVECLAAKAKGLWCMGTITCYREDDGLFNVEYDDPALFKEFRIPAKLLRHLTFRVDDRVLGNFKGLGIWHPGVITSVRDNGKTYNVVYDDEELFKEYKVPGMRIQMVVFREGDRVVSNYKSKGTWVPGTISCDRGDGTFNVEYDDKDIFKEFRIPAKRLKRVDEVDREGEEEGMTGRKSDETRHPGTASVAGGNVGSIPQSPKVATNKIAASQRMALVLQSRAGMSRDDAKKTSDAASTWGDGRGV